LENSDIVTKISHRQFLEDCGCTEAPTEAVWCGKDRHGGYLTCIRIFVGTECFYRSGFDTIALAGFLDSRVCGRAAFEHPERGYLSIVKSSELFPVATPRKGITPAIDSVSGKLVWAHYDSSLCCIVCSFKSSQAAARLYSGYELTLTNNSGKKRRRFEDLVHLKRTNGIESIDVHPSRGDTALKNSLLALGGRAHPADYQGDCFILDPLILECCRS
jgi:hypothetical protein